MRTRLAAEDAKALAAITTGKAAIKAGDASTAAAVRKQLLQFDEERDALTQSCIQSLQSSMSGHSFQDLDVYVRSVIGGNTVAVKPPLVVPTAPLSEVKQ